MARPSQERTRNLNCRVTEGELVMLDEVARHAGVTVSEWIRSRLRREHARIFGSPKPAPRPKR